MADLILFQQHCTEQLERTPELARQLVDQTQAALRAASADLAMAPDRNLLFQVSEAVQTHKVGLEAALATHLRTEIESELHGQAPERTHSLDQMRLEELSLVDEDQAEREIEISRTVQLIDLTAEWEWRELQAFIAVLQGQTSLRQQANPFRPAVYARALSAAMHELPLNAGERQMLLRISGRVLANLLRTTYAQACARLREQGLRPLPYKAVTHPPSPRHSGVNVTQPGALQSLLDMLPASMAMPASAAPVPTTPAQPGNPHLTFQVLPAHTAQAPSSSQRSYSEAQVLGLLNRLFAQMSTDHGVQPAVRQVIEQLQPAVLRVAGQDPQILRSDQHPAWRLINQVAAYASGYADPQQAELTAFIEFIQPRIARLVPPPGPTVDQLLTTLDEMQSFIEQQSADQLQHTPNAVARLEEADHRLAVRPILLQQVEQQLAGARVKPGIRDFLLGPWVDVLSQAMTSTAADSDETQAMMATVDDLIHSLQRPRTLDERENLRQTLPDLIHRLQRGMASIALPQADQDAILDELMRIHGHHMLAEPKPARPAREPDAADLVAQMRSEMADQAASPEVANRPARARDAMDTNIGSLPTVPMPYGGDMPDHATTDTPATWASSLQKGAWCKLFLQGQWTTAHLLWTSTNRQFFMFTSDKAGRMHSMTRRALERLRAEGLATSLEDRSLMQRAVDSMLQDLDD